MKEFITTCLDQPEDKLDPQQYLLGDIQGTEDKTPNEFMDLMKKMSPVFRQNWGSCTSASSVNGIKEFQEQKNLSEYFNYVNSKKISGNYNQQGEYIVNALKAICNYGVCEQSLFPDIKGDSWIDYVKKEPSKEAYENALKYKGKTYWRVDMGIDNFKNAIYKNKVPVVFAMKWFASYNRCPQSGILPPPDRLVGRHSVCGVGYDKDGLWVKNSFGERWGNNGYFKILFDKWDVVQPYACYILLANPKKMKLKGLEKDGKKTDQYVEVSGVNHKLANLAMLEDLHNAGFIDKNSVEWKDKIDGIIGNEWGALVRD